MASNPTEFDLFREFRLPSNVDTQVLSDPARFQPLSMKPETGKFRAEPPARNSTPLGGPQLPAVGNCGKSSTRSYHAAL